MVDFSLTEEQQAFRDMVRRFSEKEIKPIAAEADGMQDPKRSWSLVAGVMQKGLQLGFGKVMIPKEYGGIGAGLLEMQILTEELAAADHGLAASFVVCATLPRIIAIAGTTRQKEKWLRPAGEDETGKYIWAGAMTEPTGGNEIMCPLPDPSLGVRTTATRDGDGYRIKGQKCFITNAGVAEVYLVLARTRKDVPNLQGCNLFIFHKNTPGYTIGKIENKLGNRLMRNGGIFFDDLLIPREDMIGEEGTGLLMLDEAFRGNSIGGAGIFLGLARAAYNTALTYAKERIIWGRPLIQHEAVASRLVRMRMKIEACRALLMRLAWALENPAFAHGLDRLSPIGKVCSSEMVLEVASDAVYLLGGYGYMKDYPAEKYLRDSLFGRIVEGANEMNEWLVSFNLETI